MAKSSINFAKASKGGFQHNDRTKVPDYLLPEKYHLGNEVDISAKDAEEKIQILYKEAKKNYEERTGQKIQATSYKWEAVVNLNKEHTLKDVQQLTKDLEKETGFTAVQIAIHKDEGRVIKDSQNKEVPLYNHHAHITFFTLDRETGDNLYRRTIKTSDRRKIEKDIFNKYNNIQKGEAGSKERKAFNKLVNEEIKKKGLKVMDSKRLSRLQTLTAENLGMKRGKVSIKEEAERLGVEQDKNPVERLGHKQYKQVQQEKELIKAKELKEELKKARESLKNKGAPREDYAELEKLKKELESERKNKKLTKEKLDIALRDIIKIKTSTQKIEEENKDLKKNIKEKYIETKEIKEQYKNLKKEYNLLKEKYIQIKEYLKELPENILENSKKFYKEVLEKTLEFKKEKVNKDKDKDKELSQLKELKEKLQKEKTFKEKQKGN